MPSTTFRSRMLAGEILSGAWCMLNDPLSAELIGHAGYDWLVVDMEHGPVPLAGAQAVLTAIRTTPAAPLVRVAWGGSASIQPVLDSGPLGIIVPMIDTVEQAEAVVRDARFRPLGERSRGGMRAALAFGHDAATYFERANDETVVMVQVETADAVRNAPEIAALDGIDGLFVGPNDLASGFGQRYPGAWDALAGPYGAAIRAIPAIARERGKVAGILAHSAAMGRQCVDLGYTFVGIAVDVSLLATAAKAQHAAFTHAPND